MLLKRKRIKTLEIGSGHNPLSKSDVLVDKYLDPLERGGKLVRDRFFVLADGEKLPFKDKSFDFVVARHVLEHSESPQAMLNEMQRVGRAGYIETPSELCERLNSKKEYHRWLVNFIDGELVLRRRCENDYFGLGMLFEKLFENDRDFRKMFYAHEKLWLVKYHWESEIKYRIIDSEKSLPLMLDFTCAGVADEFLATNYVNRLKGYVPIKFYHFIKSLLKKATNVFK